MGVLRRLLILMLTLASGNFTAFAGDRIVPAAATATPAPVAIVAGNPAEASQAAGPAQSLLDTGLYITGSADQVHPDNLPIAPQYPLWSDGADKRRWMNLPPGTWIDASRPDAWEFPAGTRLWKEFSHAGKRIETRLIQRLPDRTWRYASYLWNQEDTDAFLAPTDGVVLGNVVAPNGRYEVPSRADCLACHEGAAVPILGASAVQLSGVPDSRLETATGTKQSSKLTTMNVQALIERGLLHNFPQSWRDEVPSIAAVSETERKVLGYLHGNCGHCHNHDGSPAAVPLVLAQSATAPDIGRERVLRSAVNARSRYRPPGMPGEPLVIAAGRPDASVMARRMQSRHPLVQMPPLGTLVPDADAIALIRRWIASDLSIHQEPLQ